MNSRIKYAVALGILIAGFEACTVKKAEVTTENKDVLTLADEEYSVAKSNAPSAPVLQNEIAASNYTELKKEKSAVAKGSSAALLANKQSGEAYQSVDGGQGIEANQALGGRTGCLHYREDDRNVNVTPPPNISNKEYASINENVFHNPRKDPLSTFSIDVDGASYANTRRFLQSGSLPPADAVRIEEFINTFDYDYPQPTGRDPFSITTELATTPWNPKSKLVHIGLQGRQINAEKLPPSNLVFLIDVSGSMFSEDKLPLLKSGLDLLIDQLRAEDRISIVVYAGAAGMVLPPTSGENKEVIREAIARLQAGGSTAGGAGLQLAYQSAKQSFIKNGNNRVILATDGDFNVGVSSDQDLVRMIEEKRNSGVFLSVLGFGTGNYKDAKMEQLADKGNGNYFYIDNIGEARKVLVEKMAGTLFTLAKDVKIQVEFNPAQVKSYRLVGYENRVLAAQDFNDDKKDAGELGAGANVTALYEIVLSQTGRYNIDPLKYRSSQTAPSHSSWKWLRGENEDENSASGEILTVKFRYKDPKGTTSKLITKTLNNNSLDWKNASQNFRFSAAVAGFGLVLRNSQYRGDLNLDKVFTIAKGAKGAEGRDLQGHRAEFLTLVETAKRIAGNNQTSYREDDSRQNLE